jgi:CDP-diacylglycerol--glycerol-3-phosphate 3-phosphatidyltransferase
MTIPVNLLTASRAAGIVPFLWLVSRGYDTAAFVFFIALALTDAADGYLARKYRCVTDWGKFFDPTADKALIMTAIFAFLRPEFVLGFLTLGFYEGLLFVTAVLAYLFPKKIGQALGANRLGKVKVWAEIVLVALLFVNRAVMPVTDWAIDALFGFSILLAIGSLFGHGRPVFKNAR